MHQSKLFGKTIREAPKDEVSANAKFLVRGGFVYKTMAGVYDYLPLGFRVLQKINTIIREEMNAIGGQEVQLTALQPRERWEKTDRWKELGKEIMYQFKDHSGREIGLAVTHEEPLTEIARHSVHSYKDLPLFVYQIQNKFRDELRAKSGLLRGREFMMKDLYSFHADKEDFEKFYSKTIDQAYRNVFKRCGLDPHYTEASGGSFTRDFTHEYQVFSDAGEDVVFYCVEGHYAQNAEIASVREGMKCPKCKRDIKKSRAIEVGNIFPLGTKYSGALGLNFQDTDGNKKPVIMGSYGIGATRLVGTIVEIYHDDQGIMWPENIAPFRVHLIELVPRDKMAAVKVKKAALTLYENLLAKGIEVLYDEREEKSAGEKFADADLIGIPWRAVISEKTLAHKAFEVKKRGSNTTELLSEQKFFDKLKTQNAKIKTDRVFF